MVDPYKLATHSMPMLTWLMPQIIYHLATSLDGFIADKDGGVDWLNKFNGMADKEVMTDFSKLMD